MLQRESALSRLTDSMHAPKGVARASWTGLIAILASAVAWMVYATGGTAYVYAHAIYLPILLAAMVFGVRGALLTALLGGLLLGPFMPLDVAAETPQSTVNWVFRTAMLCLIAAVAGLLFQLLHAQLDRMSRIAFVDLETGLPNRLSLDGIVTRALRDARGAEKTRRIFVISVQIANHSELVNTLGVGAGRELIAELAAELRAIGGDATAVCRMFTDCFAMVKANGSRRECHELVSRVAALTDAPRLVGPMPVHLELHMGVAAFPYHEDSDPEMLIRKSVLATAEARSCGKTWCTYDRRNDRQRKRTLELLGALKPALENDLLALHYQPKVRLEDGSVAGFEALLRWQRNGEDIPPQLYIGPAERCGLIHPLTRWVIEAALEQLALWRNRGIGIPIAVNLSGRNLVDDGFLPWLRQLMGMHSLEPGELVFELTENTLFIDMKGGLIQLEAFRELGIGLAIDDFGTGYSSLSSLQRLPVDELKIDRSLVARVTRDRTDAGIVASSIALAKSMGMRTVAEGVEDDDTATLLRELDCEIAQGFLYSRALPPERVEEWLRSRRPPGAAAASGTGVGSIPYS